MEIVATVTVRDETAYAHVNNDARFKKKITTLIKNFKQMDVLTLYIPSSNTYVYFSSFKLLIMLKRAKEKPYRYLLLVLCVIGDHVNHGCYSWVIIKIDDTSSDNIKI